MPRYLVERSFPDPVEIPLDHEGVEVVDGIVEVNAGEGVTWLHSYVTADKRASFCVYDGPDPEAIRRAAGGARLPVTRVSEIRVLNPYFYR